MIEKFSDYEGGYLSQEGTFEFEITNYELKDSSKGNTMAVFECKSEAGSTTIYHSLSTKARWSYNNLIAACLKLTPEQRREFQLDYETIGNELVGKKFMGYVEAETYNKEIKIPLDDGTFETSMEVKESFKIKSYSQV